MVIHLTSLLHYMNKQQSWFTILWLCFVCTLLVLATLFLIFFSLLGITNFMAFFNAFQYLIGNVERTNFLIKTHCLSLDSWIKRGNNRVSPTSQKQDNRINVTIKIFFDYTSYRGNVLVKYQMKNKFFAVTETANAGNVRLNLCGILQTIWTQKNQTEIKLHDHNWKCCSFLLCTSKRLFGVYYDLL